MRLTEQIAICIITSIVRLYRLGHVRLTLLAVVASHLLTRGNCRADRRWFVAIVAASILLAPPNGAGGPSSPLSLFRFLSDGTLPGGVDPTNVNFYDFRRGAKLRRQRQSSRRRRRRGELARTDADAAADADDNDGVASSSAENVDEDEDEDEDEDFRYEPIVRPLRYQSGTWTDADGRVVRFRGVNLPAKTPHRPRPLRDTSESSLLYSTKRAVSYVNRPLMLEECDGHFRRLANFGYNLVRLSVPWEAVMHDGPDVIDAEYLRYLSDLVDVAARFGIYVLVDPHQDVWSRFAGGSGAPWWTLEVAGFDTTDDSIHAAGCASLHQHFDPLEMMSSSSSSSAIRRGGGGRVAKGEGDENGDDGDGDGRKAKNNPPKMLWPTNYGRLATATMFTLFFAGDRFAPGVHVDSSWPGGGEGVSIQSYLQDRYFIYIDMVANFLRGKPNIIGFGTMNEPSNGFVGLGDLGHSPLPVPIYHYVSAFDSMRLGSGETVDVPFFSAPFVYEHTSTLNTAGRSCWKSPERDVWRAAGVYDVDESTGERRLLRPHHFRFDGDFMETFLLPFYRRVQRTISRWDPRFVVYAEPHVDFTNPSVPYAPSGLDANHFGWAPHWYDAATLFAQSYNHWAALDVDASMPVFTPFLIDWAFRRSLQRLKDTGRVSGSGESDGAASSSSSSMHVLLGETGAPFNMDDDNDDDDDDDDDANVVTTKVGKGKRRHYLSTIAAMDRTLRAVESADLDYVLWNYQYDSGTHGWIGDQWNGEDLSIFSGGNGRGLRAAVRPYVRRLGGGGGGGSGSGSGRGIGVHASSNEKMRVESQSHDIRTLRYDLVVSSVPTDGARAKAAASVVAAAGAKSSSASTGPSVEMYIPAIHYSDPRFEVSSGEVIQFGSYQRVVWSGIDLHSGTHQTLVLTEGGGSGGAA